MVVVRESPNTLRSPVRNTTQWPPKSPFEALLSSPSGRKKWEDRQHHTEQRTPSPSPSRQTSRAIRTLQPSVDFSDEEDEETLQLKLQHIEAKLKLKELQKSKARGSQYRERETEGQNHTKPASRAFAQDRPELVPPKEIEVPVSPIRAKLPPQEQLSPARARLGLTSIPRAEDVSLKRARDGTQIKRSDSLRSTLQKAANEVRSRPKSFNERLADSKISSDEQQIKRDRLDRVRSTGFSQLSRRSTSTQDSKLTGVEGKASGHEGAPAQSESNSSHSKRTLGKRNVAGPTSTSQSQDVSSVRPRGRQPSNVNVPPDVRRSDIVEKGNPHFDSGDQTTETDPGYDSFSDIHLSKRHVSHSVVAREMAGKQIYPLPRLLKEIKSPDYEPPDCESDYVVFAILASKSEPFDHAKTHRTTEKHGEDDLDAPRNKFMVLRLCDLKWEIDCYLFGTAFTQFWKLTPGTLLAILNPAILPPKGNQHNGRFSLKLSSSEDSVMEIGTARDLGYCSSIKRDGQQCGEWIDKSKTEACDFHISLLVDKQRKHRMEVNTMWRGVGNSDPKHNSRAAWGTARSRNQNGGVYHREYGQLYSVNTAMGKSAATLLDAEDTDALHNMTQAEASRKRVAAAQKERDLAARLAQMGNGVGAEYLRASNPSVAGTSVVGGDTATDARSALFSKPSAAELGLLSNKASDAHLSPAKDRKRHFGLGALSMTTGGTAAMGWGGARTWGLLQPKETRLESSAKEQTQPEAAPERSKLRRARSPPSSIRSTDSASPQKKRARFALPKGIREPGRESLPGEGLGIATAGADNNGDNDEDDDDLDIV